MLPPTLPAGFIAPCLPTRTHKLLSGSEWLREIKHDGFRVIARKGIVSKRKGVRPIVRAARDWVNKRNGWCVLMHRKGLERRSKKYAPVQNVSVVNWYMDAKDFHQKYKTGRVGLKKRMSRASASRPSGGWRSEEHKSVL